MKKLICILVAAVVIFAGGYTLGRHNTPTGLNINEAINSGGLTVDK